MGVRARAVLLTLFVLLLVTCTVLYFLYTEAIKEFCAPYLEKAKDFVSPYVEKAKEAIAPLAAKVRTEDAVVCCV